MKYILAIDQSTSGTKAVLIDERGEVRTKITLAHDQFYPAPGRVEHDAEQIYQNTISAARRAMQEYEPSGIAALGIANQRETTVIWDARTGKPVCPAVVWQDVRGAYLAPRMEHIAGMVCERTGLLLSPYYPALKAAAVLDQSPELKARAKAGELRLGTIDSYLLYRLTSGRVHATDVSNASRTQLMSLTGLRWDPALLDAFGIPESMMPDRILHSDSYFGETSCEGLPKLPIRAVMGDSHASLFGHGCLEQGKVKTSYGTGSSIMLNVGESPVFSKSGLSASVGFGFGGKICYVLEGNITCSADTLCWLRDELRLIDDVADAERIAASVADTQGVCLVPAFAGLGAPHFDSGARALISGMNRGTTRAHVVRAALESIAHQNADVLDAMARDMGAPLRLLHADGGGAANRLLMQMQADLTPIRLRCAQEKDLTALGVGVMAGISAGLMDRAACGAGVPGADFGPQMPEPDRRAQRAAWSDAVRRAR